MSIEKTKKGMFVKIIAFVAAAMVFLIANVITAKADPTPNYLTFTAEGEDSTVTVDYKSVEGSAEWKYSTDDDSSWKSLSKGETINIENGKSIQLRAKGLTTGNIAHFKMSGKIAASGSVTSLTDKNGGDENVALTDFCYLFMFSGCDSLTKAPELPATTLKNECYRGMFRECTSLTKAPKLPVTIMKDSCYEAMFLGCTNLTEAPELPATTLDECCYQSMFSGCTSLTKAPELPATTLARDCYQAMFQGCSNLTKTPELPATTLATSCYFYMFYGCHRLTEIPELPATTLAPYCYNRMFGGCIGLQMWYEPKDDVIREWKIPATSDPGSAVDEMFYGCPGVNEDFCLDPNNTSLDIPVLNKVYYLFKTSPKPTPNPQPTSSTDKDDDDDNKKDRKERKYVDLDTNKSELPYGYVLMLNLEDMKVLQNMKVHPVDSKTNTNQQFLTQMFANQMGKKARVLLTKSIHPRNPLTKEQLGVKKYLKWFHLEKKAQPIYAVCYNETDKAYYMTGTLDENGTAILRDFIARDATNITLFVLE